MMNRPSDNGQLPSPDRDAITELSVRTRLLRAAADTQLTVADEKALHAHLARHPEDHAVIEFEQRLRNSIAASVCGGASGGEPSAALKDRIQRLRSSADQTNQPSDSIPFMARLSSSPPRTGPTTHWIHRRSTQWLAIAASIALLVGITYFTISQLPPPHRNFNDNTGPLAQQPLVTAAHRAALVSFVSSQHEECELHAGMIGTKLKIDSLDKAPVAFRQVLGRTPDLGRLAASGLEFRGAGPCAVPGRGTSMHMVFDAGADASTAQRQGRTSLVSIFIQQDSGELKIEEGRTYRLMPIEESSTSAEVFVWKADGFVYFLSSTHEPAMEKARLALGARSPSGSL